MFKKIIDIYNNKNFNNSFWSALDVVIYPLFFIATTPFFIQSLGTDLYGIWLLMITINVSIQIFNFGIGSALIFYTAKYISSNNKDKLYRIFNTIINFMFVYIPLMFAIGYLFSFIIAEKSWFNIPQEYKNLSIKSVKITALIAGSKIVQNVFMSILNGKEIYLPNTLVNTFSRVLTIIIAVVLIINNQTIYEILLASLFINLIAILVLFWQIKYHFKGYIYKFYFNIKEFTEIIQYGYWVWLQSIFSIVAFQLDKFFVTAISGPTLLVYYSLSSTIVNQMHMVFGALSAWLLPRISRLIEQNKDYKKLYLSVRYSVYTFASISILVVYLLSSTVLELWLGVENAKIMLPIFLLFLIYESLYSHTILPVFLMQGIKKIRLATFYTLVYKISIILSMIFAFITTKDVDLLLTFMILPLFIVLPILHFIINKKTLEKNNVFEALLIFMPSFILVSIVLLKSNMYTLFLLPIFLITIYNLYYKKIDFKLLKNSTN